MKKHINIILIASFAMAALAGCSTTSRVSAPDNYNYSNDYNSADVSYETFYNELQPYGSWVNYPEYGNVWQPNIREGFRPYETGGHWVSTVDGWAWASDYNWGWAPFHYGRWFFDQSIGWAWVPGYEWAPAWVTWGQYNNNYAWAPLAPQINIGFGSEWRAPANYWSFVPRNCIGYSNLNRYTSYGNYNTNVNNITIINNYNSYNQKDFYHRGPDYREVSRFTHKTITPVGIAATDRPGATGVVNKRLEIYRPSLQGNAINNSNSIRDRKLPNVTRPYQGNINNDKADGFSNSVNNEGSKIIREDMDNTNRQLQRKQIENMRELRNQRVFNNRQAPSPRVLSTPQVQPNNQQNQQNTLKRNDVRSSFPADNVQPARPQPRLQDQRIMQRQQDIRMAQPQMPSMPQRTESRQANPIRNTQVERPANTIRRPSRF